MRTPIYDGRLSFVVVRKVVFRHGNRLSCRLITQILVFQRIGVVFRMSRNENLLSVVGHNGVNARFLAFSQYFQLLNLSDIVGAYGGMAGMRHLKNIVKAPEQNGTLIGYLVLKYAEHFAVEGLLLYAEVVVQSRLCSPADMKCAVNVTF